MGRLIEADDILRLSHDVTLEGGAKHRCFDVTRIYEIPKVDAIPIEYIEDFLDWDWHFLTDALRYILDKWKEEQEEWNG